MSFPTFDSIDLGTAVPAADTVDTGAALWETPEHIAVPPVFTDADLKGLDFLKTYPDMWTKWVSPDVATKVKASL